MSGMIPVNSTYIPVNSTYMVISLTLVLFPIFIARLIIHETGRMVGQIFTKCNLFLRVVMLFSAHMMWNVRSREETSIRFASSPSKKQEVLLLHGVLHH